MKKNPGLQIFWNGGGILLIYFIILELNILNNHVFSYPFSLFRRWEIIVYAYKKKIRNIFIYKMNTLKAIFFLWTTIFFFLVYKKWQKKVKGHAYLSFQMLSCYKLNFLKLSKTDVDIYCPNANFFFFFKENAYIFINCKVERDITFWSFSLIRIWLCMKGCDNEIMSLLQLDLFHLLSSFLF